MEGKKKKKKILWIVIAVIVVIFAVVLWIATHAGSNGPELMQDTVEVEPVKLRSLSDSISLKGTISGLSKNNVVSAATAEVKAVNIQVGDEVNAGDTLVILDTAELEKQIARLEQEITNADALSKNEESQRAQSLTEAQEDRDTAVSRAETAYWEAQNAVNDAQWRYDSALTAVENKRQEAAWAKEQLDAAAAAMGPEGAADPEKVNAYQEAARAYEALSVELATLESQKESYAAALSAAQEALSAAKNSYSDTVTSANRAVKAAQNMVEMGKYQSSGSEDLQTQLGELRKQLEDCTLYAPCSGVVTAVNVSVGDTYAAGQTMVSIEDTSGLKVVVEVKESDILKLSEGMKAVVKTEATGEEEMEGEITRVVRVRNQSVNPNAMDGGTSAGYSAEISIKGSDLLVGMNATARIILKEKEGVLAVPYDLIQYDENENPYVLVAELTGDGQATAVRRDIILGEEVDYYTEITGGDLQEGELLIYDYAGFVVEGQQFVPSQSWQDADDTEAENE